MKTFRFKQAAYFFYECCCKRKYTICYDDHSGEYTLAAPVRRAKVEVESAHEIVIGILNGKEDMSKIQNVKRKLKQALNELESDTKATGQE